eukprot:360723-Chlamydomonas_euryale.AAC.5
MLRQSALVTVLPPMVRNNLRRLPRSKPFSSNDLCPRGRAHVCVLWHQCKQEQSKCWQGAFVYVP